MAQYPQRPGEADCRDFLRTGRCKYGESCKYNHPPKIPIDPNEPPFPVRPGEAECQYYLKHGTCKFGQTCKFHHPLSLLRSDMVALLPQRPTEPNCLYYLRNGRCKFGATCKFHHPLRIHHNRRSFPKTDFSNDDIVHNNGMIEVVINGGSHFYPRNSINQSIVNLNNATSSRQNSPAMTASSNETSSTLDHYGLNVASQSNPDWHSYSRQKRPHQQQHQQYVMVRRASNSELMFMSDAPRVSNTNGSKQRSVSFGSSTDFSLPPAAIQDSGHNSLGRGLGSTTSISTITSTRQWEDSPICMPVLESGNDLMNNENFDEALSTEWYGTSSYPPRSRAHIPSHASEAEEGISTMTSALLNMMDTSFERERGVKTNPTANSSLTLRSDRFTICNTLTDNLDRQMQQPGLKNELEQTNLVKGQSQHQGRKKQYEPLSEQQSCQEFREYERHDSYQPEEQKQWAMQFKSTMNHGTETFFHPASLPNASNSTFLESTCKLNVTMNKRERSASVEFPTLSRSSFELNQVG